MHKDLYKQKLRQFLPVAFLLQKSNVLPLKMNGELYIQTILNFDNKNTAVKWILKMYKILIKYV